MRKEGEVKGRGKGKDLECIEARGVWDRWASGLANGWPCLHSRELEPRAPLALLPPSMPLTHTILVRCHPCNCLLTGHSIQLYYVLWNGDL